MAFKACLLPFFTFYAHQYINTVHSHRKNCLCILMDEVNQLRYFTKLVDKFTRDFLQNNPRILLKKNKDPTKSLFN